MGVGRDEGQKQGKPTARGASSAAVPQRAKEQQRERGKNADSDSSTFLLQASILAVFEINRLAQDTRLHAFAHMGPVPEGNERQEREMHARIEEALVLLDSALAAGVTQRSQMRQQLPRLRLEQSTKPGVHRPSHRSLQQVDA